MKKLLVLAVLLMAFNQIQAQKNYSLVVGEKAEDITLKDTSGNEVSLYEWSEKSLVLVDFWASWCGPCRQTSGQLVELYNDFKDEKFEGAKKGFKIVSISLDMKMPNWKYAIRKDSLYWPWHMSDLGGWNSKVAQIYGVQFVPQCFLMDADGTILGTYLFAHEARKDIEARVKEKRKKS